MRVLLVIPMYHACYRIQWRREPQNKRIVQDVFDRVAGITECGPDHPLPLPLPFLTFGGRGESPELTRRTRLAVAAACGQIG